MKKSIAMLLGITLLLIMTACSSKQPAEQETEQTLSTMTTQNSLAAETEGTTSEPTAGRPEASSEPAAQLPEETKEEEPMKEVQFYIIANGTTFPADFADNDSADAFRDLLREGDLTINMSDYGSFEKVGSIGTSLPRKDTQISTTTGDVMLYQGDQIVIFYGTNSWSYSRLGKIEDATAEALLSAFGSGDVAITFSLTKPQ